MHEHVEKRAQMQGDKESQTGGIKQARQAYHCTEQKKSTHQASRHHGDVFSQVVTPK